MHRLIERVLLKNHNIWYGWKQVREIRTRVSEGMNNKVSGYRRSCINVYTGLNQKVSILWLKKIELGVKTIWSAETYQIGPQLYFASTHQGQMTFRKIKYDNFCTFHFFYPL